MFVQSKPPLLLKNLWSSPKTDLFEIFGAAVFGKDIKKNTSYLFNGVLRDSVMPWGREGATTNFKWEEFDFRLLIILSPSNLPDFKDRGLILPGTHPCTGSQVLALRFVFALVSVDFIRTLGDNTSGEWQKFYVRSHFFPLGVFTLQSSIIWWEKFRNRKGILFFSHSYWFLQWFWNLSFEELAYCYICSAILENRIPFYRFFGPLKFWTFSWFLMIAEPPLFSTLT